MITFEPVAKNWHLLLILEYQVQLDLCVPFGEYLGKLLRQLEPILFVKTSLPHETSEVPQPYILSSPHAAGFHWTSRPSSV